MDVDLSQDPNPKERQQPKRASIQDQPSVLFSEGKGLLDRKTGLATGHLTGGVLSVGRIINPLEREKDVK